MMPMSAWVRVSAVRYSRGFPQGDATERLCENLAIVAISTEKVAGRPPPGNHTYHTR